MFFVGPVYLIQFKFRQLEIPPNYNANHLGMSTSKNYDDSLYTNFSLAMFHIL